MQIKKFLLSGILCACVIFIYAQNSLSGLSGQIKTSAGEPIPGATIKVLKTNFGTLTDANGNFKILNVSAGNYHVQISAIGFKTQKREITVTSGGPQVVVNFSLSESSEQMETVNVVGRTKAQEVNRQAFNVTAIDATKLYNTTLDISGALDRVAGVRVRETGGVGSSFNVSLNGFSGSHIRYFIDGIPMDNFGSSFQINNIPINLAERVEVYKGVVPMWLGSDALGGAVNIVTGNKHRNYLDASYSYGSFNTHRSVVNASVTSKSGFTVQLNAFQNYSDNNYKTDLPQRLLSQVQGTTETSLRRFNDTYHNETLIANVGVVDKSFADNLLIGITLGENYKEIQTGARPDAVFGQLHRRGNIIMPSLKYKKTNLIKGLDVTLNANYNFGYEKTIDTARADYDWDGIRDPKATIGEREGGQLAKYMNNNGLATAMASYKIAEHHSVAVNNVFSTFNRKTDNLLIPANNALDPAKKVNKNVLGFGYSYDVENKWSSNFFGKYIHQNNVIGSRGVSAATDKMGYGLALAYYLNRNLQLRTSYEKTNRMPEATEIFGDLENQEANPALKPEESDNLNFGIIYNFQINEINRFSVTANAVYRYSADFIYNRLNNNQTKTVADNREGVRTLGTDAEIRYSYKNWLSAGTTITYQYLQNLQQYEPNYSGVSPVYLDQMPNIPYLFGNTDVSASFRDVGKKGNNLTLGYNLLYVHAFWLYWPSLGGRDEASDKKVIPLQLSHDLNFVYSMKNGRYNISFEARNITNKPTFDNFSLQKPGRGFYLNLRYFINKS
ncbi:TonB-dependent receptor domain-containing protein [Pedobacter fastidiosus]|uniref:TonB-dependent receptor n=1 Tax=Pedobacter fastidiosus TaxID=2765361 RepID=A0ABR7KQL0_9SPHI|nr:TonB-dependent receptor [Pedobacter fastidiosus]MBC6110326.1 TonB-dependent receptor [Pedobacter fastidiosus]